MIYNLVKNEPFQTKAHILFFAFRKGQYAISVNKQCRVCFEWHDGNAYNVEIVDYH